MLNKTLSNNSRIGDISKQLGFSVDTLRYYEKIGLLPRVRRTASGVRSYSDKDISRLKFLRRAQKMNFSLTEIASLLQMREDPQHARQEVRELTLKKLVEIEGYLQDLATLRNELTQLTKMCAGTDKGCPIIEDIENGE
jgi:MerR family copper efflux transcriptional regulator